MLDNKDRQEIYKMLKEAKEELRHELIGSVNDSFDDRSIIKDSATKTDAQSLYTAIMTDTLIEEEV